MYNRFMEQQGEPEYADCFPKKPEAPPLLPNLFKGTQLFNGCDASDILLILILLLLFMEDKDEDLLVMLAVILLG